MAGVCAGLGVLSSRDRRPCEKPAVLQGASGDSLQQQEAFAVSQKPGNSRIIVVFLTFLNLRVVVAVESIFWDNLMLNKLWVVFLSISLLMMTHF